MFDQVYSDTLSSVSQAVQLNDVDSLEKLISRGKSVNVPDNRGWMPLHHAADKGHLECVKLLVEHGCEINWQSHEGSSALLIACNRLHRPDDSNREAIVSCLLKHPEADVNLANNAGWTPMHCACKRSNINAARMLAARGARWSAKNNEGESVLHSAVRRGTSSNGLDVVKYLVSESPGLIRARDLNGLYAFQKAIFKSNVESACFLIGKATAEELNQHAVHFNALAIATKRGLVEVVEMLLEMGADPNIACGEEDSCFLPINYACEVRGENHLAILDELIKATRLETMTGSCLYHGDKCRLRQRIDPFATAISFSNWAALKKLVENYPADSFVQMATGNSGQYKTFSPLTSFMLQHRQINDNFVDIVRHFVNKGCSNVNAFEEDQMPPIMSLLRVNVADDRGKKLREIVDFFVENGATGDNRANFGEPLILSSDVSDDFEHSATFCSPYGLAWLIRKGVIHPEFVATADFVAAIDEVNSVRNFALLEVALKCLGSAISLDLRRKISGKMVEFRHENFAGRTPEKVSSLMVLARASLRRHFVDKHVDIAAKFIAASLENVAPRHLVDFMSFSDLPGVS